MKFLKPVQAPFVMNPNDTKRWIAIVWKYTFYIIAVYVTAVILGERFMKHRRPFVLKKILIGWNLFLVAFNAILFIGAASDVIDTLLDRGLYGAVCIRREPVIATLGIFSVVLKAFELFDTAFIVMRKRKLIFLHWYHHATAFLLTALGSVHLIGVGPIYLLMNTISHVLMYGYYFLNSLDIRRHSKYMSMALAATQIIQLSISFYATYLIYYYKSLALHCDISDTNFMIFITIIFSYLLLFLKFFRDTFTASESIKRNKTN